MNETRPSVPITEILRQCAEELARTSPGDRLVKAEINGHGAIRLQIEREGQPAWLAWREDALHPLDLSRDSKVPLAGRLSDPAFAATATVLAYRPGKRLTLLDASSSKPHIVKGFRRGRLDEMIPRYESAHAALSGLGVQAPDIIDYDRDNEALVMNRVEGVRLRLDPESADMYRMAGEALRAFQDHEEAPDESRFGLEDELRAVDQRASRLAWAGAEMPPGWRALRDRIGEATARLPSGAFRLAHRDLHDGQFVQQPRFLALLDFDLLTQADDTLDAANFLAHLSLRAMQGVRGATPRSVSVCGREFLQGLGRMDDDSFWERLRFFQSTTFARLALVYLVRPDWAHLAPDLVTMGNRCLDDFDRLVGT